MKDIKNLTTIKKMMFDPDTIPFAKIATATGLQIFSEPFNFKNIELGEDVDKNVTEIRLSTGEYKFDGKLYPINMMTIDRRSMGFNIFADSKISEKLFMKIVELLSLLAPEFQHSKPIVSSIQTQCVVTLDVDAMDFFSRNVRALLTNVTSTVTSNYKDMLEDVAIRPKTIRFEVTFKPGQKLIDKALSIGGKFLVIEPREGTVLNQRIFYTLSPTDTDTHIKLLKQFEKSFAQKK